MRTRFVGPFKQVWFSVCSSAHENTGYDEKCPACNAGMWVSVFSYHIFSFKWFVKNLVQRNK